MKKLLPFFLVILIIILFYAYNVIAKSRESGMAPFTHKILACEKEYQKFPEDYEDRSKEFKENYPLITFPKVIALKWNWNFSGEFVNMKWRDFFTDKSKIFDTPFFSYTNTYLDFDKKEQKMNKGTFEFNKKIPSPVGREGPYPEYIVFTIVNDGKLLFVNYLVGFDSFEHDAAYKCVETNKPIME